MVGFDPAIKENQRKSSKNTINPDDFSDSSPVPGIPDFSLPSLSIPDFGFIDKWIMQTSQENCKEAAGDGRPIDVTPVLDCSNSERIELLSSGEVLDQETSTEVGIEIQNVKVTKESGLGSKVVEDTTKVEVTEAMEKVSLDEGSEGCDLGELSPKMEEEKEKGVDLPMNSEKNDIVEDGGEKESTEIVKGNKDEDSNDSESEDGDDKDDSSTSSSDSSSSESSDEEEEELGEAAEIEEGEIQDFGDTDDEEPKGPIKSKNEVQNLPPVPKVDVALEPHHQTLPVGVVLSIMDNKVIVEGVEKHNPLNEGSILWITETRSVLGLIDEIFGPVKNPYYIVRYNSEEEVPAGISQGTPISFVAKFAEHVLNDKNVYKKGYDASGENDEEADTEAEFSDDEKEAEYKRMQKLAKRGSSDGKKENRESFDKKFQHKSRARNNNQSSVPPSKVPPNQPHVSPPPVAAHSGSGSSTFGPPSLQVPQAQSGSGGSPFRPSASQVPQAHGGPAPPPFPIPSNMGWTNGPQFQQNMAFPNGFPMNGMPFQQPPSLYQYPHQVFGGFTGMPMPQPFDPSQRAMLEPPTMPYGQPNFPPGIPAAMPMFMGQPGFNPGPGPYGMGFQGFHSHPQINPGEQGLLTPGPLNPTHLNEGGHGVQFQGLFNEQSHGTQRPPTPRVNFSAQNRFNRGGIPTRGGRSFNRGGRHPNGGRGRGNQEN